MNVTQTTPSPQIKVSPHSSKGKVPLINASPALASKHRTIIQHSDLQPEPNNFTKSTPQASPSSSSSEEEDIVPLSPVKNVKASPGTPSRSSTRGKKASEKSSTINSSSPLLPRLQARKARARQSNLLVNRDEPPEGASGDQDVPAEQRSQEDQATVESIAASLRSMEQNMRDDHAMSTRWLLQDAREATQSSPSLAVDKISPFASMISVQQRAGEKIPNGCLAEKLDSWTMAKSSNKMTKSKSVQVAKRIFGDTPRVPRYSSHTTVSRNILSADSEKLKYVPYLGDVAGPANKDTNFKRLLKELEEAYSPRRIESTRQCEKASRIRAYVEAWLGESQLDCDQRTLIQYMMTEENANELGLRDAEREMLLASFGEPLSKQTKDAGEQFWEAFDKVFDIGLPNVLLPTELLKEMVESARKKTNPTPEKAANIPGDRLGTYTTLTCLICAAVDCQTHADYSHDEIPRVEGSDDGNHEPEYLVQRQPLVLPYHDTLRRFDLRKKAEADSEDPRRSSKHQQPCSKECWRVIDYSEKEILWEQNDLDAVYDMLISITDKDNRACYIAFALHLPCWQVHGVIADYESRNDTTRTVDEPTGRSKRPDWYNNKTKTLHRDWQEMTKAHLHQERSQANPCTHEGHCTSKCPCFEANILCESFCGCSDDCPRRFTGCSCLGNGLTCVSETCICILMNRECGPECISCGAIPRINPANKHEDHLFTHGCQNVYLQRGVLKASVMGESQLEGVGFGLYLAEPVQKGDFLSEYTGEVISSQEAERRGIIYDRKFLSFLFDLNKDYVIDAARLGNNTRFINHADNEKDGLNCEAKIILVNGEHRIKFVALRDIAVGEELLFNYGKKFAEKHGLSKKLPKAKEGGKKGVLVGEEALDALDGVDQRQKSARKKVEQTRATRGRPRGSRGRGGSKMRKTAPARQPILEDFEEPIVESLSQEQEDDMYTASPDGDEDEEDEQEPQEPEEEESSRGGRPKRKTRLNTRYTR